MSTKKMGTLAAFLFAALTADAQMRVDADVIVNAGVRNTGVTLIDSQANIAGSGSLHLAGNIVNNKGTPDAFTTTSNMHVVMRGTVPQTIGGTTPTNFPSLTIDNIAGVELLQDQSVKNQLIFQQGLLDLNGRNIDLGTTGSLSGESDVSRATDIFDGGTITATRTLNTPTNQDPANMRLNITSPDNLGSTNIVRGHTQKVSASGYGIYLWYVVTPTNAPTAVTNKVTYFNGELAGVSEPELDQWQKNGATRDRQYGAVDIVNANVTATSTGFGDTLTLGGTISSPLPVTWANDFKTTCKNGIVDISRSVYTEINNAGFEIEHSVSGISDRQSKGFVPTQNGNTGTQNFYTFQDTISPDGTSYYRIKQIDNNQNYKYSSVFGSYCDPIKTRTVSVVYPNPTDGNISINVLDNKESDLPIKVTNQLGQIVREKNETTIDGSKIITIDISPLAAAMYYITIGDQTQPIIKQ